LSPRAPFYTTLPAPEEVFSFYELPIEYAPVVQHQPTVSRRKGIIKRKSKILLSLFFGKSGSRVLAAQAGGCTGTEGSRRCCLRHNFVTVAEPPWVWDSSVCRNLPATAVGALLLLVPVHHA
jgi:hypothetical protein